MVTQADLDEARKSFIDLAPGLAGTTQGPAVSTAVESISSYWQNLAYLQHRPLPDEYREGFEQLRRDRDQNLTTVNDFVRNSITEADRRRTDPYDLTAQQSHTYFTSVQQILTTAADRERELAKINQAVAQRIKDTLSERLDRPNAYTDIRRTAGQVFPLQDKAEDPRWIKHLDEIPDTHPLLAGHGEDARKLAKMGAQATVSEHFGSATCGRITRSEMVAAIAQAPPDTPLTIVTMRGDMDHSSLSIGPPSDPASFCPETWVKDDRTVISGADHGLPLHVGEYEYATVATGRDWKAAAAFVVSPRLDPPGRAQAPIGHQETMDQIYLHGVESRVTHITKLRPGDGPGHVLNEEGLSATAERGFTVNGRVGPHEVTAGAVAAQYSPVNTPGPGTPSAVDSPWSYPPTPSPPRSPGPQGSATEATMSLTEAANLRIDTGKRVRSPSPSLGPEDGPRPVPGTGQQHPASAPKRMRPG
ncbi:hypothetical protein ABT336_16530 [Micromonospora sp. NPDC000207]|uniref:hypothetical protein n=1 Tax=Micromonospora sp. NPDC000207 TaxID=3154246 RepID=UPI0033326429